jgi:hypothetical protein
VGGSKPRSWWAALHVGLVRQIVTMIVVTVPLTTLLAFGGGDAVSTTLK